MHFLLELLVGQTNNPILDPPLRKNHKIVFKISLSIIKMYSCAKLAVCFVLIATVFANPGNAQVCGHDSTSILRGGSRFEIPSEKTLGSWESLGSEKLAIHRNPRKKTWDSWDLSFPRYSWEAGKLGFRSLLRIP